MDYKSQKELADIGRAKYGRRDNAIPTGFRIYFINFDYFAQESFSTLDEAIKYGISKGFEFSVQKDGKLLAAWSILRGITRY
jgi:hypothetical protein